jgi:hypothetical protein
MALWRAALGPVLVGLITACSGDSENTSGPGRASGAGTGAGGSTGGENQADAHGGSAGQVSTSGSGEIATGGTGPSGGGMGPSGGGTAGLSRDSGGIGGSPPGEGGFTPSLDAGGPPGIPQPAGACPDFVMGDVTFNPPGGARRVAITIGPAAMAMRGPLIFYWFATGSNPTEANRGLPIGQVIAAGGIVVAPYDVAGAGVFPWLSQFPQHDALFDEVLGCAVQKTSIDTARVHALGFSAGALMTTHLSFARSKYLASVAAYSGGAMGQFQESNNKFAAMIMTGGTSDVLVQNFFTSSHEWQQVLKDAGHFAMFCDHGGGHSIPTQLVPGVWQFFVDHPYGRVPSPYSGHIPGAIAPPCIE